MAAYAFPQQITAHLVQRGAGLFSEPLEQTARYRIHGGVIQRVNAVSQHQARAIGCRQFACILQGRFRLAAQIRSHNDGLHAHSKAHGYLPAPETNPELR